MEDHLKTHMHDYKLHVYLKNPVQIVIIVGLSGTILPN